MKYSDMDTSTLLAIEDHLWGMVRFCRGAVYANEQDRADQLGVFLSKLNEVTWELLNRRKVA
jgi:hypothetical protein